MSGFDDYKHEIYLSKISDQDIERLLSGETPEAEELVSLAHFVAFLRAQQQQPLPEETVSRLAAQAATIVRSATAAVRADRMASSSGLRRRGLSLRTKLATTLAALLLLGSMTGVAIAANGAVPGDTLYGVDLALEKVGIGAGQGAERLQEAQVLVTRGRAADALAHAAAAFAQGNVDGSVGASDASDALFAAAEAVRGLGDERYQEMEERVAALLEFLVDNAGTPETRLQVAEMAKGIAGAPDDIGIQDGAGGAGEGSPPGQVPPVDPGPPPGTPATP